MKNNYVRIKLIYIKRENNNLKISTWATDARVNSQDLEIRECYRRALKIREKAVFK